MSIITVPDRRAELYNEAFPTRPKLISTNNWVCGTWLIGACYKNPNPLYGAYPRGYLDRVHAMFPDAWEILHVFSGGLTLQQAKAAAGGSPSINIELVDIHGPNEGRYPTYQGDVSKLPSAWLDRFDLILADPPYSKKDAVKYNAPMINRARVMKYLREVAKTGGNLVWLDQCWPPHSKKEWKNWGQIGLVRSTNHRVRLVSMFEAI